MGGAWDSAASMGRLARAATMTAVIALAAGLALTILTLPFAAPAFVLGTAAAVVALFARFRSSHLHDVDELRR